MLGAEKSGGGGAADDNEAENVNLLAKSQDKVLFFGVPKVTEPVCQFYLHRLFLG